MRRALQLKTTEVFVTGILIVLFVRNKAGFRKLRFIAEPITLRVLDRPRAR